MDLSLFFDPISDELHSLNGQAPNFAQACYLYHAKMPDLEGMDLALIGLQENRGGPTQSSGISEGADTIREKLYTLKKGSGTYKIVDLGNLRSGPTLDDTYQRIQEVCHYLMEKELLPILIGGTHDLTIPQYQGYEDLSTSLNVMIMDALINLGENDTPNSCFLSRLINHHPNNIFELTHIGHQSYLVGDENFALIESLNFEAIRIGTVKENIQGIEPLIRSADMISWDLSVLNHFFAPAAPDATPYGLSGEEACQLSWYAGLNDKLTSFGLYEYDKDLDDAKGTTAFVAATMIWYFIEGYYNRVSDKYFKSDHFLIYEVDREGEPASIRFFKSRRSEKWWMEVPDPGNEDTAFLTHKMIPCSYQDYESALSGEIPTRWISAYTRLH